MVSMYWLLVAGFAGLVAGVMTMSLCAISGRGEWECLYQQRIAYLQAMLDAERADNDRWLTEPFGAPPDPMEEVGGNGSDPEVAYMAEPA